VKRLDPARSEMRAEGAHRSSERTSGARTNSGIVSRGFTSGYLRERASSAHMRGIHCPYAKFPRRPASSNAPFFAALSST